MARKPQPSHQPLLPFADPGDTAVLEDNHPPQPDGDHHALQDDLPATARTASGPSRAAQEEPASAGGAGPLCDGAEDQSRSLEGATLPGDPGEQREPDSERGAGDRPPGVGGPFTLRITAGRQRDAVSRRGNGFYHTSHAARVKASRQPLLNFNAAPAEALLPSSLSPPGAVSDGTLISPPGRASGNPVPPEGLPQISAGPVAARAEPRLGADSLACRQAPSAGPVTPGKGDRAMNSAQLLLPFNSLPELDTAVAEPEPSRVKVTPPPAVATTPAPIEPITLASGEKGKARDILAAIHTVKRIEHEQRPATPEERQALARFAGFGPVALSIFPAPATGRYKDAAWQALGEELKTLLTSEE